MRMMRGIALREPIALAALPDDMIVGDPSGFDVVPSRKTRSRSPPSLIVALPSVPPIRWRHPLYLSGPASWKR
jgi:hypothetical protein